MHEVISLRNTDRSEVIWLKSVDETSPTISQCTEGHFFKQKSARRGLTTESIFIISEARAHESISS